MSEQKYSGKQAIKRALDMPPHLTKLLILKAKIAAWNTRQVILRLVHPERYHEIAFTKIFEGNKWGGTDSRSGPGSNEQQTGLIRAELLSLLTELRVSRFLDIPCGDFRWMKNVQLPSELTYIGGDVVEKLIDQNNSLYGNSKILFHKLNLVSDSLPKCDLIMCRDCLVHFSLADIARSIQNMKKSRSRYLLATHFTKDRSNHNIRTGDWRPLNLTLAPFNFPQPIRVINERCSEDGGAYGDKCLALWRLAELP